MNFLTNDENPIHKKIAKNPTLIAQGTYGCVYYPGFTTTGRKQTKKIVTKLQKNSETLENEIEIAETLKKIANYGNYFAPILISHPISITKLQEYYPEQIRQCKAITTDQPETPSATSETTQQTAGKNTLKMKPKAPLQKINPKAEFYLNEIRYILGEELDKTLETKLLSFSNTNNPKKIYEFLLNTYVYLSKALQKLESKNIYHYDLKANNIIHDVISDVPIIIDFGLSIPLNKINPQNPDPQIIHHYFFDTYEYDFWCLEPIYIGIYGKQIPNQAANKQKLDQELGKQFLKTITQYADFVYIFKPEFTTKLAQVFPPQSPLQTKIRNFKTDFQTKWHKYITEITANTTTTNQSFFATLWEARFTWDHYSLAVIYLEFLSKIPPLPPNEPNTPNLEKFTLILLNIILALPHERKTVLY